MMHMNGAAWRDGRESGEAVGCDGGGEGEWLRRRCRHERRLRRLGGGCGDGWRAVVVMEDDTLASGCAGGAGGGGSTGDGGSVDGRYDACSALHEHVDGVDLCAGSDGDGGDDGWW